MTSSVDVVSERARTRVTNAQGARVFQFTIGAAVAALLVLALIFSASYGTRRITDAAQRLNLVNEVLRPATVTRAQLALGVNIAAQDRQFGTNSASGLSIATEEAGEALAQVDAALLRLAELGGSDAVAASAEEFLRSSRVVLRHLERGESLSAQMVAALDLDDDFQELLQELVAQRDALAALIAGSDAWLHRIATWTRFAVAFLLPMLIILTYRQAMRRRHRQAELELSLAAEKELGRSRDEFIANASHELRTPLTSIYGLALLLEEDESISGSETAMELINLVVAESIDLGRIVEDLLTSARLDAGELQYVLVDVDVAAEAHAFLELMQRSGTEVEVACEQGSVRADRLRLRQLLRNLLSNAMKYGGKTIRLIGHVDGADYVCIVEDDGPGVSPEIEARLFDRFARQDKIATAVGSVGLGLSIAQALAAGQGGSVEYQRVQGWTRFVVRLPLAEADAGRAGTDGRVTAGSTTVGAG